MAFQGTSQDVSPKRPVRRVRDHGPAPRGATRALGLIGVDVAHPTSAFSARRLLPVLIAALIVALGVAALRTELLRVRYGLAEATLEEQRLLEVERTLTAQRRKLRDPVLLARKAAELGFARPEHLMDLPAAPASSDANALAATTGTSGRRPVQP